MVKELMPLSVISLEVLSQVSPVTCCRASSEIQGFLRRSREVMGFKAFNFTRSLLEVAALAEKNFLSSSLLNEYQVLHTQPHLRSWLWSWPRSNMSSQTSFGTYGKSGKVGVVPLVTYSKCAVYLFLGLHCSFRYKLTK